MSQAPRSTGGRPEAWQDGPGFARVAAVLLVVVVVIAHGAVLGLGLSPEDWTTLGLLRDRGLPGALAPLPEYPYWRPLWYAWLWLVEHAGLTGGLAHLAPLVAHALAALGLVRLMVGLGVRRAAAAQAAALACIVPGTVPAMAWLAAGNKAFVLCALVWGAVWLREARTRRGFVVALVPAVLLPLACSENGYAMALLYPLVLLLPGSAGDAGGAGGAPVPARERRLRAAVAFAAAVVVGLAHLAQLPGTTGNAPTRTQELVHAFDAAPLASALAVLDNLGRYFVYGLSGLADRPRQGLVLLLIVAALGLAALRRGGAERRFGHHLLLALAAFAVLNVPASLFPGEASRHHAYLPATGAALVVAALGAALPIRPRLWGFLLLLVLLRLVGGQERAPWRGYLDHSERVWATSLEVLPSFPEGETVTLLNVPYEYRAAFVRRFGHRDEVWAWPDLCVMTTRASWLPPAGASLPTGGDGIWIAYDGEGLRRLRPAELAARPEAPRLWALGALAPFPRPVARWGQVLGSERRLEELPWSMDLDAPVTSGGPDPGDALRLLAEGGVDPARGVVHSWEFETRLAADCFVVLGWSPLAMPTTENVGLFHLTRLPWLFAVELHDLDREVRVDDVDCVPVLGLLPALHLPASPRPRRWRAELRLRR